MKTGEVPETGHCYPRCLPLNGHRMHAVCKGQNETIANLEILGFYEILRTIQTPPIH